MRRTLLVAWREFRSVVFTKGFLIGVLLVPVMIGVAILGGTLAARAKPPAVQGRIAVVDASGTASEAVLKRLSSGNAGEGDVAEQVGKLAADQASRLNLPEAQSKQIAQAVEQQAKQAQASRTSLTPEAFGPDADIEALKKEITVAQIRATGEQQGPTPLLALAVIPAGAVRDPARTPEGRLAYGQFELFVHPQLDFEIQESLRRSIGRGIVDTRLASDSRLRAGGLTADDIRALMDTPSPRPISLSKDGEKTSLGPLQLMIPFAFMILLMMSVMTGGAYLMTAVVEEKGSRVMEVLLSAVSPMQLMVGKIVGQMCVAMLMLGVFGGLGVAGLVAAAAIDLVPLYKLAWLVVYFFLAFFVIASMMAAVGSAVNEMREAQTLQTPVMAIVMLPWLLVMPISRAPNSGLATALSFVPGLSPFVMVIRLGGSDPIPTWQYPATVVLGVATAVFAAWAAAKIFRIGVLMYGKPPDFRTLIRWVRMA
ncbi:MAG: ABC transporter permease [Planctomycetaceae bacterium]|jgi:ABC-type Na+ efflux pump permease subunit|nr:ABC transporter permease [Phycisphaerales bacterium]MCE2652363.1 ABC transporter permease [Planctomycetaceae bacterium]